MNLRAHLQRRFPTLPTEDLLQQALLIACRIRGEGPYPDALLRTIADREACQMLRRQSANKRAKLWPLTCDPVDLNLGPAEQIERQENSKRLQEALATLPELEREAIEAVYVEGATFRQAAQRLGLALATVTGRVSRARQRLRQRLRD